MCASISQGKPTAFLVKAKSLKNSEASFFTWLQSKGFKYGWCKGHYNVCDWVFVNITYKLYACGMPGVEIAKALGNHAITIDEFKKIYAIYEKYEGLGLMEFNNSGKTQG